MKEFLLIFIPKKPLLSDYQLDKLSDVFIGIGHLFFGSMVVPFFIPSLDKAEVEVLILGLVFSLIAWLLSVWIIRKR